VYFQKKKRVKITWTGKKDKKKKECQLTFHIQQVPIQSDRTWAINKHAVLFFFLKRDWGHITPKTANWITKKVPNFGNPNWYIKLYYACSICLQFQHKQIYIALCCHHDNQNPTNQRNRQMEDFYDITD
jgi:hypothetical protein